MTAESLKELAANLHLAANEHAKRGDWQSAGLVLTAAHVIGAATVNVEKPPAPPLELVDAG